MIYRVMISLLFVFMCNTSYAQERRTRLDGVLSNTELTDEQQLRLREYLKGLTDKGFTHTRNDYVDDFNRGAVRINREKGTIFIRDDNGNIIHRLGGKKNFKHRNYSYHKIAVRDGATIGDYDNHLNFRQKQPDTVITTAKNLTFINANLTNVLVDESWTLIGCINEQVRFREVTIGDKTFMVQRNRNKETGIFEEIERHEIFAE